MLPMIARRKNNSESAWRKVLWIIGDLRREFASNDRCYQLK